jgi:tetratricopeptide (TPR) repeat protein
LLQQGHLAKAERLCRDVLHRDPANPDARNLLGVLAMRNGKPDQAVFLLATALRSSPNSSAILNNHGRALRLMKRWDEALASFDKALALKPGDVRTLCNRGLVLAELGRREEALRAFDAALATAPDDVVALSARGRVLADLGRPVEALASYDRALSITPDDVRILSNRGLVLVDLKRPREALDAYEKALTLAPGDVNLLANRGRALTAMERLGDALASYGRALAIAPDDVEALFGQGLVLARLGRHGDALESFERASRINPTNADIWSDRGLALSALGRDEEAVASFDRALALKPDYVAALCNRGTSLGNLGRDEAERESYRRALALRPDDPALHWNEAIAKLLHGDFAEGWREYEWRWAMPSFQKHRRCLTQPLWTGEQSIAGQTILLHAEQGYGDTIQFCRYVEQVETLGARVILEVPPALVSLLARMNHAARVVARGDRLPMFDLHCPLLSLPRALGTRVETIPCDVPYLRPSPDAAAAWRARLGSAASPRVGIAWSGSLAHKNDHNRSMTLAAFARLLVPGIKYVCLQKELRPADERVLAERSDIQVFGDQLGDFDDTAGLVSAMDLVISVDTSAAHLAGALGRPVWLLLPFRPDFRWLLDRADSPWYPTMRLFRQRGPGDWDSVIEPARDALLAFLA